MFAKTGKMNKKISTRNLVLIGMFAAVLAVLSQISIPMPSGVPVTLQTFGVALCACILGWKRGIAAVLLYLLIGVTGLPVFSGFRGGINVLFGPTGGFLIGFLFMSLFVGRGAMEKNKIVTGIFCAVGLLLCHICGILQFMHLMEMSFWKAAMVVSLPYLIKDGASVIVAVSVGTVMKRRLSFIGFLYQG